GVTAPYSSAPLRWTTPRRSWPAPPRPPSWPWFSTPSSSFSTASPCPAGSAAKLRACFNRPPPVAGRSPITEGSPLRLPLQQRVEAAAETDDLGVKGREPGADPVRAVEEGLWGLALAPDPDAEHQAAGVDETHILQHAPGGRQTHGDGAEQRVGGQRFRQ